MKRLLHPLEVLLHHLLLKLLKQLLELLARLVVHEVIVRERLDLAAGILGEVFRYCSLRLAMFSSMRRRVSVSRSPDDQTRPISHSDPADRTRRSGRCWPLARIARAACWPDCPCCPGCPAALCPAAASPWAFWWLRRTAAVCFGRARLLPAGVVQPPLNTLALKLFDMFELLQDVIHDTEHVVALHALLAHLFQALHHILQAHRCSPLRPVNPCCISRLSA